MIASFDASAFVKLFIEETGSKVVRRLWQDALGVFASTLAYPETHAALATAARSRRLTPSKHDAARREFAKEWRAVVPVNVGRTIAEQASDLAGRFSLSGADAVHLATANAIATGEDDLVLATWDRRLSDAARSCGLAVVP